MDEKSRRELVLRSEGAEVPGRGAGSHRQRIKKLTSKARRADGKQEAATDTLEALLAADATDERCYALWAVLYDEDEGKSLTMQSHTS